MPLGRFAGRQPGLGGFNAVIHGVAQQVHEWVADFFHHGLVQLGLCAADDQVDVLAQFLADIAHHPTEAVEGFADGDHAQAQGAVENFLHQ
ncbi:hypothetical protein D3C78_1120990 [compost metagenome]